MVDEGNVDLGLVQIHKKALADIAHSAISEIEGVSFIAKSIPVRLLEFFGKKSYPGITVTIDKSNQVSINVKICVRYGINISDIARQVQDNIRHAVERIADVTLKDVQVNIYGIERGGE